MSGTQPVTSTSLTTERPIMLLPGFGLIITGLVLICMGGVMNDHSMVARDTSSPLGVSMMCLAIVLLITGIALLMRAGGISWRRIRRAIALLIGIAGLGTAILAGTGLVLYYYFA